MGDGHRKRKGTLASEDFVMNVREECMNRRTHFIIITAYYMYIWRNRPEVLIRLAIAYVAGAENLLDLARNEELLELEGEVMYAMRDMQISNDKDEDHGGNGRGRLRLGLAQLLRSRVGVRSRGTDVMGALVTKNVENCSAGTTTSLPSTTHLSLVCSPFAAVCAQWTCLRVFPRSAHR